MLVCSLVCYIVFSIIGIEFHRSYLNYIAFIGVFLSTLNMIYLINQTKQMKFMINYLLFQFIHLYLYLAHLLSVKFELNFSSSESKIFNIFNKK
jgi:hypothetical protein